MGTVNGWQVYEEISCGACHTEVHKTSADSDTTPSHLVYKLLFEDCLTNIKVQIDEAYYYSTRIYYNLRYSETEVR